MRTKFYKPDDRRIEGLHRRTKFSSLISFFNFDSKFSFICSCIVFISSSYLRFIYLLFVSFLFLFLYRAPNKKEKWSGKAVNYFLCLLFAFFFFFLLVKNFCTSSFNSFNSFYISLKSSSTFYLTLGMFPYTLLF